MKRALFLPLILLTLFAAAQQTSNDGQPIEAGLTFTALDSVAGITVYKPATTAWSVHLWDSTGKLVDSASLPASYIGPVGTSFPSAHAPGQYTLSYYSPSGDYSYTYDYYLADSTFLRYTTHAGAGVFSYGYGMPSTPGYRNSDYSVRPVLKSTNIPMPPFTDPRWTFTVLAPPDGGPAKLADSLTLRKAIFGFDPPGPQLEPPFTRRVGGKIYRYTLYVWGVKRELYTSKGWIDSPY